MTSLPDPTRPGVAQFSTWWVGGRQQPALDSIAAAWRRRPWPTPDLLAYTIFPGADGGTLLHFSQWTTQDAFESFTREHRDERIAEIDAAVPGIERIGLHRYRHHRSLPELPGTPASFTIETPEPDRIDAVLDAPRPPGLLVAHGFVGGGGALILRDWTTVPAGEAFGWPLHLSP